MRARRRIAAGLLSLLLLSSLGAATPIVVPPIPEKLVEGHTVFGIIDVVAQVNRTAAKFAAAVAVLVREYQAVERAQRFPGVLWFSDQYLTNPTQEVDDGSRRSPLDPHRARWRYPCGGAVLAVNSGDPDPRVAIARINGTYPTDPLIASRLDGDIWENRSRGSEAYGGDYAWLDVEFNATDPTTPYLAVHADTLRTHPRYQESYIITDPNDHTWFIDKYEFYRRDAIPGPLGATIYAYPVWVVNVLGTPVYVPDDPELSCVPFADILSGAPFSRLCHNADDTNADDGLALDCPQSELHERGCGAHVPNGYDTGRATPGYLGSAPFVDDPCAGYREPSRNGYCYGGQANATAPCSDRAAKPLRTYNALLYFELEDLTVPDDPRDHSDPYNGMDTNGCFTPPSYDYNAPDEWPCPAADDDAEGNSHPFHPTSRPHAHDATKCPDPFAGPNPTNHGGSTTPDARCDYLHATRNIDIYFGDRPAPPLVRRLAVTDLEGSDAPFHDHHRAYPGSS